MVEPGVTPSAAFECSRCFAAGCLAGAARDPGKPVRGRRRANRAAVASLAGAVLLAGPLSCSRDDSTVPAPRASADDQASPSAAAAATHAQVPGVSEARILFGQSAAFSGPARELGRNMRLGIEAAFHEANGLSLIHI